MTVHIEFRLRLQSASTHERLGQCVFIHNWSSLPIKIDMLRKWLLLSPYHFLNAAYVVSDMLLMHVFKRTVGLKPSVKFAAVKT